LFESRAESRVFSFSSARALHFRSVGEAPDSREDVTPGAELVTRALSGDWQRIYGHPVYFVKTVIDPGQFRGTCYRAANWL
jgi:hypothetical protein